ncbi:murein biosynthesis integral membrane protein MurJ [candidate division WOR-3 bacterium]|nr:murein biosynthesis integral membrane protein MurJ [candidate division WOR-3 bacterium]
MSSQLQKGSETKNLIKSAGKFSFGVFVSRVLGLSREIIYAMLYGAGNSMDAFRTAYIIPGMVLEFISEGTMNAAFIPVFSDIREKEGKKKALLFAVNLFNILLIISSLLCGIGIIFAPYIVKVFAGGYDPQKQALTVSLVRILFPLLVVSSSTSLLMGFLNYFRHYTLTGLAPALWNLISIVLTLLLFKLSGAFKTLSPFPLAIGILIGSLAQLIALLPSSYREGFKNRIYLMFSDRAVKRSLMLFLPVAVGYVATRINVAINQAFATHLGEGAVSHYSFAFRLMTFPLGIIGVSLATVSLPETARHASSKRIDLVLSVLLKSLRLAMFFSFPVCFLMWVLKFHLVRIIYQHGMFSAESTVATADILGWFLIGIAGASFAKILSNTFYSLKDTKTPVFVSFLSSAVNIALVLTFRNSMKINGLALAVSISSLFNGLALLIMFHLKYAKISLVNLTEAVYKTFLSSFLPALSLYLILKSWTLFNASSQSLFMSLTVIFSASVFYFLFYLILARALKFKVSVT